MCEMKEGSYLCIHLAASMEEANVLTYHDDAPVSLRIQSNGPRPGSGSLPDLYTFIVSAHRMVAHVSTFDVSSKDRDYLQLSGSKYPQELLVALAGLDAGLHTYMGVKINHGDLLPS